MLTCGEVALVIVCTSAVVKGAENAALYIVLVGLPLLHVQSAGHARSAGERSNNNSSGSRSSSSSSSKKKKKKKSK